MFGTYRNRAVRSMRVLEELEVELVMARTAWACSGFRDTRARDRFMSAAGCVRRYAKAIGYEGGNRDGVR